MLLVDIHYCILYYLWIFVQASAFTRNWNPVNVEKSIVQSSLKQEKKILTNLSCAMLCSQLDWCNLWCTESLASFRNCTMTNLLVSSAYSPGITGENLNCYTIRKRVDYAANATISTGGMALFSLSPSLMVDGIHPMNDTECPVTAFVSKPWFLIDLGTTRTVTEVVAVAELVSGTEHFGEVEIRIGQEQKNGDFSSYTPFAYFAGTATKGQEIVFTPAEPVVGRFVSFERKKSYHFGICYIEVR